MTITAETATTAGTRLILTRYSNGETAVLISTGTVPQEIGVVVGDQFCPDHQITGYGLGPEVLRTIATLIEQNTGA